MLRLNAFFPLQFSCTQSGSSMLGMWVCCANISTGGFSKADTIPLGIRRVLFRNKVGDVLKEQKTVALQTSPLPLPSLQAASG